MLTIARAVQRIIWWNGFTDAMPSKFYLCLDTAFSLQSPIYMPTMVFADLFCSGCDRLGLWIASQ